LSYSRSAEGGRHSPRAHLAFHPYCKGRAPCGQLRENSDRITTGLVNSMRFIIGLAAVVSVAAQASFFPLAQVQPGMKGVGRTVFSGERIEEFGVEILGVLENAGPRQSLILARLSGGPLASTGVLQGMSGSPVYIDGRLLGAVAMAFSYSKEPIAAIRPIEDLLRAARPAQPRPLRARARLDASDLTRAFEPVQAIYAGGAQLTDIATPMSFGGFTRSTVERFAPQLRALGFEPQQGLTGGGRLKPGLGKPSEIQPGSMISIQLLSGDMSVGADGTVTHVEGNRIYAFGHRLLSIGTTELPFARSEVLALVPNLSTSFKISAPRQWMGTILEDRATGVAGELGRQARLVPVKISVRHPPLQGESRAEAAYEMQMVDDPLLSPLLLQMAVSNAVEATERTLGGATLRVRGRIEFLQGPSPLRIENSYSGDSSLASRASQAAAAPLAYAMQNASEQLRLKDVQLEIEAYEERRELQVAQVWTSRREVRPGEELEIVVVLAGPNGMELTRKARHRIPVGARPGPLYVTAADASTANTAEYRQYLETAPRSAAQLVGFLNGLRNNTSVYLRLWRPEANYTVGGMNLPSPPPSVGQILGRLEPPGTVLTAAMQGAKAAEYELDGAGMVVSGSKTVAVEIRE